MPFPEPTSSALTQSINNNNIMSTIVPPPNGKINFAGMVGAKRRRMRSGGNVSTLNNSSPKSNHAIDSIKDEEPSEIDHMLDDDDDEDDEKTAPTSKCKGATTIPIFLKSELCRLRKDALEETFCCP